MRGFEGSFGLVCSEGRVVSPVTPESPIGSEGRVVSPVTPESIGSEGTVGFLPSMRGFEGSFGLVCSP
jgi:hypothetical protein